MSEWSTAIALALCLTWLAWTARLWWQHRSPRPAKAALQLPVLVAYASQSGSARALAVQQQQALGGPQHASLMALSELVPKQLAQVKKAVFVVSTYGDGEPPDNGRRFYHDLRALSQSRNKELFNSLNYEVVALGDRSYPKFCQFGDDLYRQLASLGAKASAPLTKLDQSQSAHSLHQPGPEQTWRLTYRQRLNTQADAGLFHLRLNTPQGMPKWRAGDLVAIQPNNDASAAPRRYSIASAAVDGEISLIVRQHITERGELGLCSGWLTQQAALESGIKLQLIENTSCHIDDHAAPLLLIGAGSGLAGIRGHLAERAQHTKAGPAWLIYGERAADPGQSLHTELALWQQRGVLSTLDCAFSRDPKKPAYVQDIVREQAAEIADFIGTGGHVYVCGRYEGMGTAVDAILREALGAEGYQQLMVQGRYHRDLY
ncbi:MAG: NADPH cytochrome P450 oxidoreductase family protein [Idiomarina sp.]